MLHHYTVDTGLTMPGAWEEDSKHRWTVQVPRIAMDYEPLLSQILALAALHSIHSGGGRPGLALFRDRHLGNALRPFRQSVMDLTPQSADAVCFMSVLLLVDAFAALKDRPTAPYEPPMSWFRVTQGARHLFVAAMEIVQEDENSLFLGIVRSGYRFARLSDYEREEAKKILSHLYDSPLLDEGRGPEILDAYRETVVYIGAFKLAISANEHPSLLARRLMSVVTIASHRFVDAIEEKRPIALVILAYLFALASHASELWWIGGTPYREFCAIRDQTSPSLQHLFEWPIRNLP
jgi:hypothetical protein